MTFDEAQAWLDSTQFYGVKLGLENTARLLEAVGNPHPGLRVIHVAGTNGKGSVCAMLDAVLRAGGIRCGLYTSPHLVSFRERIRIDGQPIPEEVLAATLTVLRRACADWDHSPTFFEIATVAALAHFAAGCCEAVVLETGMGGRLDATNIVTPAVSVITPIALDHCEWLGSTLGEIAAEKAGIIKPGVPVVSAPQDPGAHAVLASAAARQGAAFRVVETPFAGPLGLLGRHQAWNAALAVAALESGGFPVSGEVVARGLREVRWPARFQRIGERFLVDGAHNPHAMRTLVSTWQELFRPAKATVVFGALQDKDYGEMIRLLSGIADEFRFVPIANPRGADPVGFSPITSIRSAVFPGLGEALHQPGERILITGSLFLAGEALHLLEPGKHIR